MNMYGWLILPSFALWPTWVVIETRIWVNRPSTALNWKGNGTWSTSTNPTPLLANSNPASLMILGWKFLMAGKFGTCTVGYGIDAFNEAGMGWSRSSWADFNSASICCKRCGPNCPSRSFTRFSSEDSYSSGNWVKKKKTRPCRPIRSLGQTDQILLRTRTQVRPTYGSWRILNQ